MCIPNAFVLRSHFDCFPLKSRVASNWMRDDKTPRSLPVSLKANTCLGLDYRLSGLFLRLGLGYCFCLLVGRRTLAFDMHFLIEILDIPNTTEVLLE